MSDTPTQAAALPPVQEQIRAMFKVVQASRVHDAWDALPDQMRAHPGIKTLMLAMRAWMVDQANVRDALKDKLAQQAQELDALRAALRWSDVRTDGPPPCDGEAVFDGINSAGYPAAFNAYDASDGDCYMETAEGNAHVMGDLRYWRRHVGPATEGEANV